jgi:integrase
MAYVRKRGKHFSARWRTRQGLQAEKGGFATKREAEQFAEEQEALERRGKNTRPSDVNMTIREFVQDIWGPSLDVERQTKIDYENNYNSHIDPFFGDMAMSSITPAEIKKWRVKMKNEVASTGYRLSPSYVEKLTNLLGQILRSAMDNDKIYVNPMTKVKRKKLKHKKQVVPLEISMVQALADGFASRWKPVIWIGFFTGMRPSEILGLTWDRLDFENEVITVNRQIGKYRDEVFADYLKTSKSYRVIPFPQGLQKILIEHKELHGLGPENLIFTNRSGGVWRYKDAADMFRDIARPLGIKKGDGLHQLRHTFVSMLIRLNTSAKVIQEWVGHESILETMDTYGHLFPNDLRDVSQRFDTYVTAEISLEKEQLAIAN